MKAKISIWQLFWLVFSFQIGLTLLMVIRPAIQIAKQDIWISVMIAGIGVIFIAIISVKVSMLYPDQTLIQFSQTILGKWFGKIIVIPYFIMWFFATGMILRQFSDFVHIAMFERTPLWALILPFVLLGAYTTKKGGIEVVARCCEIIGPIVAISFLTLVIFNWGNMDLKNIFPIYADSGGLTIVKGSIPILSFLGEAVLIMMTVPFIAKPQKTLFGILAGGGLTVLFVLISSVVVISTFGPELSSKMLFPPYEIVRFISTMEFIQNMDVAVVMIWFFTYFVKMVTYFFFTSYATAQWLELKEWKKTIWVVAAIVFMIALWPKNFDYITTDFMMYWEKYVLPINMIAIPLLLLIVGIIRKKTKR
ncbi:spore germination protein [Paenibacillus alginolyticus]|uniref:GerAB/ArcD/ProY family transporter n=1 Tax=Paenibacillus alginolyticus TaxID=59839 RepID=UPI0004280C06|nr:endospore germination permease [Paenibacillus alginolyticus]MCY9664451.1 spore germination protein [Paenibacillus alginolyticus]